MVDEPETFKLSEYRRGTGSRVACPKCNAAIPAETTRCPYCGVHFRGAAHTFAPDAEAAMEKRRRPVVRALVAAAVGGGLLLLAARGLW